MRLILDKILWGTLIVLFGPSVMIVASWNALPGDNLYGVKLALEKAALALASPSYATSGNLQIKYTERRFAEAKQLMASKQSIQGLPYLDQQITDTKKAIENAPNKEAQVAFAKGYINTLSTVAIELEAQKQTITMSSPQTPQIPLPSEASAKEGQPPPTTTPSPTPTPVPTSDVKEVPTSEVKRPTLQPTPTPIQVAQVTTTTPISAGQAVAALQIDQTQQNVSQTIADLQTLVKNEEREENNKKNDKKEEKKDKKEKDQEKKNDEKKDNKENKSRNKDAIKTD